METLRTPYFTNTLSSLDKTVSEILGKGKRSKVTLSKKNDDGGASYMFLLSIDPLQTPEDLRAESYLTHNLRRFVHKTKEDLDDNIQKYIDLNSEDVSHVVEDLIEESFSKYLVKNIDQIKREWENYNKNPYLPQNYKKIEGPLFSNKDFDSLAMEQDEHTAVVLTPKKLIIDDGLKENLGENLNHTINMVLRKNFRKYTTVLYKDEIDSHTVEMLGLGIHAKMALHEGKTVFIFPDRFDGEKCRQSHKLVVAPLF